MRAWLSGQGPAEGEASDADVSTRRLPGPGVGAPRADGVTVKGEVAGTASGAATWETRSERLRGGSGDSRTAVKSSPFALSETEGDQQGLG